MSTKKTTFQKSSKENNTGPQAGHPVASVRRTPGRHIASEVACHDGIDSSAASPVFSARIFGIQAAWSLMKGTGLLAEDFDILFPQFSDVHPEEFLDLLKYCRFHFQSPIHVLFPQAVQPYSNPEYSHH